jgi:CPA2 family monovalent cation:H+ antiporter-2
MLIGPSGLELVQRDDVEVFAEIGVVLLLFTVGLEVSLVRLRRSLAAFVLGGTAQVGLTVVVTAAAAVGFGLGWNHAVFIGFLAALSSTAVVLKIYADRQELQSPQGMLSAGILVFQDLCLAPMILIVPILGGTGTTTLTGILGRLGLGVLVVALLFVVARRLMPRVFDWIVSTHIREVFILGVLGSCLGMALLTAHLGFSLALGAFMAGLVLSESDYSHQVIADVLPFRDVFNSLFFISVGMLIDLGQLAESWRPVLVMGAALIVGKALIMAGVAFVMGYAARIALIAGISVAQIGEFSFVLGGLGVIYGLMDAQTFQVFLGAAVFTLLLTPPLIALAPALAGLVSRKPAPRLLDRLRLTAPPQAELRAQLQRHVIVVGFGLNGRNVARVLRETAIPFVVIELDGALVRRGRQMQIPIAFGDATRPDILAAYRITHAHAVVVAISDLAATRQIVRSVRQANRGVYILVRTRSVSHVEDLQRLGANDVIPEEFETSIEIFSRVLHHYHVPRNVIEAQARIVRGEAYEMLRAEGRPAEVAFDRIAEILEATLTDTFLLRAGSPAIGKTLRQLDLRRSSGATVIAIVRKQSSTTNPSPDLMLEPLDTLVIVGDHAALGKATAVLTGEAQPPTSTPSQTVA